MNGRFVAGVASGAAAGLLVILVLSGRGDLYGRRSPNDENRLFTRVAKTVQPSVVQVMGLTESLPDDEEVNDPTGIIKAWRVFSSMFIQKYKVESMGSGVVFDHRGHIVTNHHVVATSKRAVVKLYPSGEEVHATLIGADPATDIAVIKVQNAGRLTPARFSDSARLEPGQLVLAVGAPFQLEETVTFGVISALSRSGLGLLAIEGFIQTDAQIHPGNSGGPLCDLDGKVVGVNTATLSAGAGVGFAIPSNTVKYVVTRIIKDGKVTRASLSLNVQPLTEELAEALSASEVKGVLVAGVTPGSPTAESGIMEGDIITGFDGVNIESPSELRSMALQKPVGKKVTLDIVRNGVSLMVETVLTERIESAL